MAGATVRPGRLLVLIGGRAIMGAPSAGPVLGISLARPHELETPEGDFVLIARGAIVVPDGELGADLEQARVDASGRFVRTGGEIRAERGLCAGRGRDQSLTVTGEPERRRADLHAKDSNPSWLTRAEPSTRAPRGGPALASSRAAASALASAPARNEPSPLASAGVSTMRGPKKAVDDRRALASGRRADSGRGAKAGLADHASEIGARGPGLQNSQRSCREDRARDRV